MLHRVEHAIGRGMVYVDTDSAYHILKPEYCAKYKVGFRTGDLELELKHGVQWRGLGRKSYVYSKIDGRTVCRQKGVRINLGNMQAFTPQNVIRLIEASRSIRERLRENEEVEEEEVSAVLSIQDCVKRQKALPSIDVPQRQFITERVKHTTLLQKRTVTRLKRTVFRIYATKRRICWRQYQQDSNILDTLPFGFH
jgi:hypothetical protein